MDEKKTMTKAEWLEIRNRITAGSEVTEEVRIAACSMKKEAL